MNTIPKNNPTSRLESILKMGYKPISKNQISVRLGLDERENNYPQYRAKRRLNKMHGAGNYKIERLYHYESMKQITIHYYITKENGKEVSNPRLKTYDINYAEPKKGKIKYEPVNEYGSVEIPDEIYKKMEAARKNGFDSFKVAYLYVKGRDVETSILLAPYSPPLETIADLFRFVLKGKPVIEIAQWE